MDQIFLGLGSNLGDRADYLHQAITKLANMQQTIVKKCSSVYETEPVGVKEQPQFFNMAAELDSALPPKELLRELKRIECTLGRKHSEHWGPREIDIDLLYYGYEMFNDSELNIPHPEIANRRFVLVPLKEIAAEFHDPLRNLRVEELLQRCLDTSSVRKISQTEYSQVKE